jgi:hypothetical protein
VGIPLVVIDPGRPISYLVLEPGVPVQTADGVRLGEIKRVLAEPEADVFDGLVLDTEEGDRFVDAPNVAEIYERLVVLGLSAEDARGLPVPTANPAALAVSPEDTVEPGGSNRAGDAVRRAWDLISGKY